MGWRNRPTFKEEWPQNIDTIMFIDENGDSSLKSIIKNLKNDLPIQKNNKYFTTTGCVMKRCDFIKSKEDILILKGTYWENGMFKYNQKLKRVCFHSHEIRGNKDPFSEKIINREEFINDLSDYMTNLNITIFSTTLDKEKHCHKYKNPSNPYNLCMNFMLERFVKFHLKDDENAIIILEARGKKEDQKLLSHIKNLIDNGTRYADKELFKKIKGVYFNPKWCEKYKGKKSYFGLEIADLVSYPIHKYTTKNNKDKAFKSIENKIHRYPNYDGKGIKKFP